MFGQFFGDYLIKNNRLTRAQYDEVMEQQKSTRVKLGLIAVSEKLLDEKQADEINRLQAKMDKRFGDIAVEKGYLTDAQVGHLLSLQGNPYLQFVQALIEKGFMTLEEAESAVKEYQIEQHFSDADMAALKSGDIDRITPLFVHIDNPLYNEHIGLAIRNIIRFIDTNILLHSAYAVKDYFFENLAGQYLSGDHSIFVAFAGNGSNLLAIADSYAQEEFESVDEDAFDSVCEFINCINGLFASKLSHEDIEIDMLPPVFYTNKTLFTSGQIYIVPLVISGRKIDLLVSIDSAIDIK